MELSPEERRRIYETEKARIEAETKVKSERSQQVGKGCGTGCLLVIGAIVMMGIITSLASKGDSPETTSRPAPSDPALLAQCEDLIQTGYSSGVLTEVTFEPDHTRVVVGPGFYLIDFKAKEGFCRALSYVGKSRGGRADFMLRDSRTNKQVGSFVTGILNLK